MLLSLLRRWRRFKTNLHISFIVSYPILFYNQFKLQQRPQELQEFLRRVEDSIIGESAATPVITEEKMTQPERPGTPTFDAGTQTSPMSLSRSSSFLWVSDCNCSGSLDGSVPPAPASRHSEASSVSRIVHLDNTSMSSLVSEVSSAVRRITPDSADDDDDDDDRSSVSLSVDGVGGGGVESGIGTGSPPPRDRRRRPIPPEVATTTTRPTESDESSDLAVGSEELATSSSSSSSTPSTESDEEEEMTKKREKVRRRETWEKIRRRHSCKRAQSRRKDKPEVVWIRRGQSETPPPVPPHATVPDAIMRMDPTVLHKPPVVVIQAASKPRTLMLKSSTATTTTPDGSALDATSSSVKAALQSVLSMELSTSTTNKSSSTPFLIVPRHLKPISASSTPTEPYVTLEVHLT